MDTCGRAAFQTDKGLEQVNSRARNRAGSFASPIKPIPVDASLSAVRARDPGPLLFPVVGRSRAGAHSPRAQDGTHWVAAPNRHDSQDAARCTTARLDCCANPGVASGDPCCARSSAVRRDSCSDCPLDDTDREPHGPPPLRVR